MVSIEQIQKTNKLSKELKKHGFAFDSGDAFSQAERIFDKKKKSPEVEIATEEGMVVLESPEMANEEIEILRNRVNALERFKDFSLRTDQAHKDKFSELVDKMGELTKALNLVEMNQQAFEKKLSQVKSAGSPSPSIESEAPRGADSPQPVQTDNKITEPIDKSGIAPADVSVEKIFYSGSK